MAVVGVEVASPVELEYALQLGFEPKNIVFDRSANCVSDVDNGWTIL